MSAKSKLILKIGGFFVVLGVLAFFLGPMLFASIVYPLPERHRPSIAKWVPQYCSHVPNAHHLLSALIFVESSWRESARSHANAVGLTQFIPSTANAVARRLGVTPFTQNDLISNPDLSIRFGAFYLCTRIADYGGDIHRALIAYNGGGGAVMAYDRGFPIRGTVAYSRKVQAVSRAYEQIYGSWWIGIDPNTIPSPNIPSQALNRPAPAAPSPPVFPEFNVVPRTGVFNISILDFWRELLPTIISPRPAAPTEEAGQIGNILQELL